MIRSISLEYESGDVISVPLGAGWNLIEAQNVVSVHDANTGEALTAKGVCGLDMPLCEARALDRLRTISADYKSKLQVARKSRDELKSGVFGLREPQKLRSYVENDVNSARALLKLSKRRLPGAAAAIPFVLCTAAFPLSYFYSPELAIAGAVLLIVGTMLVIRRSEWNADADEALAQYEVLLSRYSVDDHNKFLTVLEAYERAYSSYREQSSAAEEARIRLESAREVLFPEEASSPLMIDTRDRTLDAGAFEKLSELALIRQVICLK